MQSSSIDVTGGMGSKVAGMLQLVRENPKIKASIFSGAESGNIYRALMGDSLGTCIENRER
jgi:isopentenyl phosphate kinase